MISACPVIEPLILAQPDISKVDADQLTKIAGRPARRPVVTTMRKRASLRVILS
jgi:hypothetical protein